MVTVQLRTNINVQEVYDKNWLPTSESKVLQFEFNKTAITNHAIQNHIIDLSAEKLLNNNDKAQVIKGPIFYMKVLVCLDCLCVVLKRKKNMESILMIGEMIETVLN